MKSEISGKWLLTLFIIWLVLMFLFKEYPVEHFDPGFGDFYDGH